MSAPSETSTTRDPQLGTDSGAASATKPKRSMSRTQKILFFATGWLIVLMPFLFWWNTWFGRHLSDTQMSQYLHDDKKPRHIQHALVQLGDRMGQQTKSPHAEFKQWYPDLIRLSNNPVEEVRNTDAWAMGQDTSGAGFHETLLKMLADCGVAATCPNQCRGGWSDRRCRPSRNGHSSGRIARKAGDSDLFGTCRN